MKFECPHCGQHLEIEPIYGGWKVRCPTCSGEMVVPREVGRSAPPAAGHESESVHGMETLQQTIGHDHRAFHADAHAPRVQAAGAADACRALEVAVDAGLGLFGVLPCSGDYIPHHHLWAAKVDLIVI
mgnify:CR=1 FL=1